MSGSLYLIPVPIYFDYADSFSEIKINPVVHKLKTFIVEDVRTARRILKRAGYTTPFEDLEFFVLNEHTKETEYIQFLDCCLAGQDIGIMSEAGMPCIADPGSVIVKNAHLKGIKVVPLSGDSSIMLSLMASGFNGQNFAFHGYLPRDKDSLVKTIKSLEKAVFQADQTQIFIEAPYRNNQLFEVLINTLSGNSLLCVACNLMAPGEMILMKSIIEWRKIKVDLNKMPSVFLVYK